jgi:hypothetical protein
MQAGWFKPGWRRHQGVYARLDGQRTVIRESRAPHCAALHPGFIYTGYKVAYVR